MFAANLQSIITLAAPANTGVSFNAIIICVSVIILSVLVIKPLAGGR